MSIICEIDKILTDNKDYFISKQQEYQELHERSKQEQKTEAEKYPAYSVNQNIEYEE